jgi:hypothetical protein
MNLMMNIHVRACINELERQIHRLEQELRDKELLMEECASDPQVAQMSMDIQHSESRARPIREIFIMIGHILMVDGVQNPLL